MEIIFWWIIGLLIFYFFPVCSGIGPYLLGKMFLDNMIKPTTETQSLIDNIKNNPQDWRDDGDYFFNKEKGYVFWISCARAQFNCVGGSHIATRGYNTVKIGQYQRNHLYNAYKEWKKEFNILNCKNTFPHINIKK